MSLINKMKAAQEAKKKQGYIQRERSYSKSTKKKLSNLLSNLLLGVILIGIGAYCFFLWKNDTANELEPSKLMMIFGAICFFLGFVMILVPKFRLLREDEKKPSSMNRQAKWQKDYDWGVSNKLIDGLYYRAKSNVVFSLFLLFFLILLSFFLIKGGGFVKSIMILLILAVLVAMIFKMMKAVNEYLRYGESTLSLNIMPVQVGEQLIATFENQKLGKRFQTLTASLLFIKEEVTITKDSEGSTNRLISHRKYFEENQKFTISGGTSQIKFDIPRDALSTQLTGEEAQYWVLDIEFNHLEDRFKTTFLLPIYDEFA